MKVSLFFICSLLILIGCSDSKSKEFDRKNVIEPKLKVLKVQNFEVIDYVGSDDFDSRVAHSDSILLVLKYGVGHSDLYASTARVKLMVNGRIEKEKEFDIAVAEAEFNRLVDSLNLMKSTVRDFVTFNSGTITQKDSTNLNLVRPDIDETGVYFSLNQADKIGQTYFFLKYENNGIDLVIKKGNETFEEHITDELFPGAPGLSFYDVTGDNRKELIIFLPCNDYWDSQCFQIVVYDVSDFLDKSASAK